ncbi:hypothetical protein EDB86DRAFT_2985805 [Lactarius hatsudake]|nr:hypothetical protein EDB86DRAFT_2985805 [Lactarius hatsudake]
MPALVHVDNALGALFVGTVLSSMCLSPSVLRFYSYFSTSHCSQDRWLLKLFVRTPTLIDTVNLVFYIYMTYQFGVTNFGDYRFTASHPWATSFSALSVQKSVFTGSPCQ